MEEPCPRVGKWIGACKFEPRYDTPKSDPFDGMWHSFEITSKDAIKTVPQPPMKKYIRDVCVRCGKSVERK